jgi:hypothetical protein
LVTGLGLSRFKNSYRTHRRRTAVREPSWNGLGCAVIPQTISTIPGCRKVIHSARMYYTASIPIHISECADLRFWPEEKIPDSIQHRRFLG